MSDLADNCRRIREVAGLIERIDVDARMLGAKGDGVTDCTQSLNEAIELRTALSTVARLSKRLVF